MRINDHDADEAEKEKEEKVVDNGDIGGGLRQRQRSNPPSEPCSEQAS
jgi:hypothetical protein